MPVHVLIIDDDTGVTELLHLLLTSQGFEVTAVNRASEGVEIIREQKPDLLLLDLMMPEMDGWEACRAIRAFSNIPIIILSAINDPSMVAKALDLGADDYLTKPIPSNVMVALIKRLVHRTGSLNRAAQDPVRLLRGTQPLTTG